MTKKRTAKIHIHTSHNGQYHFSVTAANGRTRTHSEDYVLLSGCKRAAKAHIAEMKGEIKLVDHTI